MPDYTSILRRSISALPDASPAMREAVYQRARAALARQLTAVDPPLSTREIESQHQQLEDAVSRIETEFAAAPAETYGPEAHPPVPPKPDVPRRDGAAAFAPADRGRTGQAKFEPAEPEAASDRGRDAEYDAADDEEEASPVPFVAVLALVAIVLIGGAALLYAQRDMIAGLFGSSSETEQAALAPAPESEPEPSEPASSAAGAAVPPAAAGAPAKRPDRLTNGDVTEGGEPDGLAAADPAALAPAPPVEPLPPANDPVEQAQLPAPPPPTPVVPSPPPPATAPPAGETAGVQRAIYYEQGTDGSPGQASQGTVEWTQVNGPDGEPRVQAVLELPEQGLTATVSISKNSDETLPASHLVEVQFSGAGALGTEGVERVPALVLKPNEQARGQPLSGAAVPVTEDLFWIALSSEDEQVQRNLALLREGSWFDLPILFGGGKRALLTFEKGIPGDKVFESVLAGWTRP